MDTSAVMAILMQEDDALTYATALGHAQDRPVMSAATFVEACVVAERKGLPGLGDRLDALLSDAEVEVVSFTVTQAMIAREAYRRFRKGKHPAALNLGDCFAYALAQERDEPLLFKGNDFPRTDVKPAI